MKVLLLETLGADYGAYFLTRGFAKLLGAENVRMWPYKRTNEGQPDSYPERYFNGRSLRVVGGQVVYTEPYSGSELWADPALWRFWKPEKNLPSARLPNDMPVRHATPIGIPESSDEEIFAMLGRREFNLIVLNACRWHGSAALHELRAVFGQHLPPVVIADHDDYTQRRWDFADVFKPVAYFKRSMLVGGHRSEFDMGQRDYPVRPMPFSSMWEIDWVPWEEREVDVFCVFGATQVMRRRFKDVTLEVMQKFPDKRVMAAVGHPMGHAEYLKMLSKAKIVVDQQSFGTDTLRFWEASSAGACLLSDFNLCTPPEEVKPGTHYYKFDNDLSPNGDQQNFVAFRRELERAVTDDAETHARARRLYDAVRRDHTNAARAAYVISETEKILGRKL